MSEIENLAMKIFNSFEDCYLEKSKCKIFEELFDRYLPKVDKDGKSDTYDALVLLGLHHRNEFDLMVKVLRDHSLISD